MGNEQGAPQKGAKRGSAGQTREAAAGSGAPSQKQVRAKCEPNRHSSSQVQLCNN